MFHPLRTEAPCPTQFNNPFDYEPEACCKAAAALLQQALSHAYEGHEYAINDEFRQEIAQGKMFGVLIAADETTQQVGYLAAYSGQVGGRADWEGFVPPVFDYLQPDGYFKLHEAEISRINRSIDQLEHHRPMTEAKKIIQQLDETRRQTLHNYQSQIKEAKARRDARRKAGPLTPEEEQQLIRESQFMKAELRRLKLSLNEPTPLETEYQQYEDNLKRLRQLRRQLSDSLQQWLFSQFRMRNKDGNMADLLTIWATADTPTDIPPAGSGECCEPKLLQYAFTHNLRPLQMAMFWWGKSPKDEIRHHLHYYPACNGKCKPILRFMLGNLLPTDLFKPHEIQQGPPSSAPQPTSSLPLLYDDSSLAAINKPAGLLSVPGKQAAESVYAIARRMFPKAEGPLLPHRLDMSTSGILLIAKNDRMFHALQELFLHHQIHKTYIAVVSPQPHSPLLRGNSQGTINLPLSPDYLDRPRQRIDRDHGKEAISRYEVVSREQDAEGRPLYRLALQPLTGRTHQLRMHCAHAEGLTAPILGDPLYGHQTANRMYLHATRISFAHPLTGESITIDCPPDF